MSMSKKKLAILISNTGKGTNLQAIIDAIESQKLAAIISVVISDTYDAYGLVRAKTHGIPVHVLLPNESLIDILTKVYPVDLVVLSGWKKIISDKMIESFPNKMLNLHPGSIPDDLNGTVRNPDGSEALWNRGKLAAKAIQNVLDQQATYAGSTVHFLSKDFDFGPVLGRCFEKVLPEDTVESLYTRLKQKENELYVDVLCSLSS